MITISIRDAKNRLTELAREVENGATIVVTRNGRPVMDMVPHVPHAKRGRINLEAGRAWLKTRGIDNPVPYIADNFDEPAPEDILLPPLPGKA